MAFGFGTGIYVSGGAWEAQVMTEDPGLSSSATMALIFSYDEHSDVWLVAGLRLPAGYALAEPFL